MRAAAATALRGDAVRCPCCGRGFRRFLAYPAGFCPGCGSYERHRLFALLLEHRPGLVPAGARVLHVGPEPSMQLVLRRLGRLDYVAVDLDHPLATVEMDVRRMAFPDASFDVALCFHVLMLLADEQEALRELVRVLAPAGLLMVTDPPDRPGYPAALVRHPVDVEAVRADALCTPPEIERYGLLADECIYLCRRR